jgi:hypothetical protein
VAYCLNIQEMCDPNLVFMYVAVAGPGRIIDSRAFSCCTGLIEWFETLPDWCFVSADNAYPSTTKMLVPHKYHRAYTFYLSQLRIRIEMAFGQLTTKWRRLWMTLNFHSAKNAKIICVCTKLHNYVICRAKEIGNDYDTVGVFDGVVVDPQQYGIDPLQGGGPIGTSSTHFVGESCHCNDVIPRAILNWIVAIDNVLLSGSWLKGNCDIHMLCSFYFSYAGEAHTAHLIVCAF